MEEFNVPLEDGLLRAVRWGTADTTVIAIHGITANALAWTTVAGALGDQVTLVAPDLRGRAGSAELPGPYGLRRHARDVVQLIDFLGLERCVLVGHSMGAFVAVLTAIEYPDRVAELVLVDGGVSLAVPGTDGVQPDSERIDAILDAVLGPAMKRLTMTFETPDAYLNFWRDHPAFSGVWSADLEHYLLRDLTGRAPEYRSTCNLDAIRSDGADTLVDPDIAAGVSRVACPTSLLWAQRGMFDETPGLYTNQRLADYGVLDGAINVHPAVDANHYSILLSTTPAAIVAESVQAAAMADRPGVTNIV